MVHSQSTIKMKRTRIVILFLFYVTSCYVCNGEVPEHVYQYGVDYGTEIYNYNGNIPYLKQVTRHRVQVPDGYMVTYVKVTVKGWPKPKVTYSPSNNYVTITYDLTQLTASDFNIVAKAITV